MSHIPRVFLDILNSLYTLLIFLHIPLLHLDHEIHKPLRDSGILNKLDIPVARPQLLQILSVPTLINLRILQAPLMTLMVLLSCLIPVSVRLAILINVLLLRLLLVLSLFTLLIDTLLPIYPLRTNVFCCPTCQVFI